jgi:hypothetical protein
MPKITVYEREGGGKMYLFHCPGCKSTHVFYIDVPKMPSWTFNGNLENPTFSPSLLCNHTTPGKRCHLFLKEGKLVFLPDCEHEFAGKTVDLEDNGLEPEYRTEYR